MPKIHQKPPEAVPAVFDQINDQTIQMIPLGDSSSGEELPLLIEDQNEVQIAVNLFDLDRVGEEMRTLMFGKSLKPTPIVIDKNDETEVAVPFSCGLLRAAMMCDVVRGTDRKCGDPPTRVYLKRKTTWTKVSGQALLTVVDDEEKCRLNPKMFKVKSSEEKPLISVEVTGLPTEKIL